MLNGPRVHVPSGSETTALVIFLHGYGADGNDLIGIGESLQPYLPGTAFVSPHAPHACGMNPMGREWFPLTLRDPSEYWRGVQTAAADVQVFIDSEMTNFGLSADKVALVGFSQGTMMALHTAPRRAEALGAVVGFSGLLAGGEHLATDMTARPPYLLVHGDRDEVVPVSSTHFAAQVLGAQGCNVEHFTAEGLGHGIDNFGLQKTVEFLRLHLLKA